MSDEKKDDTAAGGFYTWGKSFIAALPPEGLTTEAREKIIAQFEGAASTLTPEKRAAARAKLEELLDQEKEHGAAGVVARQMMEQAMDIVQQCKSLSERVELLAQTINAEPKLHKTFKPTGHGFFRLGTASAYCTVGGAQLFVFAGTIAELFGLPEPSEEGLGGEDSPMPPHAGNA